MKKYKLFLLGGIFALVGVFNFSSASNFVLNSSVDYICPGVSNVSDLNFKSSDLSCGKWDPVRINLTQYNPNNNYSSSSVSCSIDKLSNNTCSLKLTSSFPCFKVKLSCQVSGVYPSGSLTLSDFSMYNQGLTPAINGLHDTVIELIPYVIYIGIGVLLFMLGFIAVRWLVNRMGGKINSIFSSKKR